MKPKTSGTSVWSNDGDPFASTTSPTSSVHRTSSVRSTSSPAHRGTPGMMNSQGIAGGPNAAPHPPQPQKKRMSLLISATSDALFSFGSRRSNNHSNHGLRGSTSSKPGSVKKQSSLDYYYDDDGSPVLDIRAQPSSSSLVGDGGGLHMGGLSEYTDEEAEREVLREEAARSVGLTSTTISTIPAAPPPPPMSSEFVDEDEVRSAYSTADASYEFVRHPSAPYSLAPSSTISPDHHHHASGMSYAASTLATMRSRSAASSQASLSVETTHQAPYTIPAAPTKPLPTSIPNFPATLASLSQFATTSSTLMRHYSGTSFFLGKSRQWKSRHIVLTSFKPAVRPPNHRSTTNPNNSKFSSRKANGSSNNNDDNEPDTQAHLHLFRSFASDERELERMKIDEDSVVFVVEGDDPVTQGRKNVIKVGGRHAGGGGAHSAVGGGRARTALAPPSAMASLSVMGAPAMAVQLGGQMDFKVVWLLQCFDSTMMHQWIAAVKGALLVQRAERAGLGMSLQTSPADVRLTGDIDVILSLRAQGLYNQPVSPTSPTTRHGAPPTTAPPVEDPQPSNRGGRSRSSTTTVPTAAVNALKGLFTTSLANGPSSGSGGGTLSRPRSISSVASTPIPMASPPKKPTPLEEDPKDASFGTRANAMLNMHLARSAPGQQPPSSASSLMLDRSIRDSLSAGGGGLYDDALVEMDFELKQKENRERLNALAAFAAGVNSGGVSSSYDRPPSVSSLPPPPRTKRPGSAGVGSVSSFQQPTPRTPVFEKDLQDELKKAMFAPVLEMGSQRSRSRTNSLRRNSTDTIPEEDDMSSSVGGRGSVLGRPREVLSIRTSIDEQGRVSIESTSNRSAVEDLVTTIPFPAPGSLLPPADLEHGHHLVNGGGGRSQFGHVGMKSSASFGVDLIHAGSSSSASAHHHPAHAYYRPPSAMSSVSTNSFQGTGSATPGASDHMSLHMSPRSDTGSSDRRAKSATAPPATSSSSTARGPSSPQRSRRVPKVMIPPPAPPPSAPLPGTPKTDMAKALHPEDASVSTRERDSLRSSFFASKRVSAASSTGVSIRSFTSGSSSSRSGPGQRGSGVHGGPPRPPPSFALPPTPGQPHSQLVESPLDELYSMRSVHRDSLNSNGSRSDSPTRSEFGVVGHSPSPLGMGSGTMGKRLLNRLTPPSNPPPTGALPPRPDSDEPPISPTSHRSGSSGSINGSHQLQHHHRTSSVISNGGAMLSTIPASPVDKVLPDLSPLSRLPELPETTAKRVAVTSSPSLPSASLNGASSTVSLLRQSSLKSRLRMLSTPSPRIQPSATLPPTSALPDIPSITHAMKIVDQHSMSFDLALPSPTLDRPIISPFIPDDEPRDSVNGSALPGHQTPPIPPRSQARPTSPRLKLPEAPQPPMMGLPLSPPPARRGNRMSKDYGLSGIARVNAALAMDNPPSSFSLTPPLLEGDGIEPAEPPVEHWEPSRRDSVMIPL